MTNPFYCIDDQYHVNQKSRNTQCYLKQPRILVQCYKFLVNLIDYIKHINVYNN